LESRPLDVAVATSGTVAGVTDRPSFDFDGAMSHDGPLSREAAMAALDHASELMASADFVDAARLYQRVVGFNDPGVTGAALLGLGEAWYRLNDDAQAQATWEEVTRLPESQATYPAWRNVAAARVRAGDLRGALAAYREADRRAPAADKAEIASRLGWLSKELGDKGAAGRYFSRARGDTGASMSMNIIAVPSIVSLIVLFGSRPGDELGALLAMDKVGLAQGELWRLWSVTLVHASIIHLAFNMFALWIAGPFVERLYGRWRFLAFYVISAAGGSLMTFAFSDAQYGVGASGAIFGLFGLLFANQVIHRPVLDRQSRMLLGQFGALIAINLVFGFIVPGIDNMAHLGGLLTGIWLGVLFAPTNVPTMRSLWVRAGPQTGTMQPAVASGRLQLIQVIGLAVLGLAFVALWILGSATWG
jgi:membrane associated rhomboid family serine protease